MQYRQDILTRMLITRVELITISIVTIQSIWHNPVVDFFYVLENFRRKLPILVAPPTDLTTKPLVLCKGCLVLWQKLETSSKSIHNWWRYPPQSATKLTKTCGSEFGALLWRHLKPQRKTAIWVHNHSPQVHNNPKDIWKFYFLYDLVRTNLFVPIDS